MAGKVSRPSRQAIVARTIAVMQARSRSCRKFLPAPPTVDAVAGSTLRDKANRRNPYFSGLKCPFEWRPQRQKPIACGQESAGNQSNPLQRRVRKIVRQHERQTPMASAGAKRKHTFGAAKRAMRRRLATAAAAEQIRDPKSRLRLRTLAGAADRESPSYEMALEFSGLKSAACGSPPRRAYRPDRRCGRVAEGGGLLNRYRVVKPYRGFESLRLRHFLL